MIRKLAYGTAALGASLVAFAAKAAETATTAVTTAADAATAAAAPVAAAAAEAAPAAAVANPGNNAWMMTSTIMVLMMILPGLALFYGGLTRSKNMLSTMTQIGATSALAFVIWVIWGYSTAFGPEGNAFIAWGKFFLAGVTPDSLADTFSDGFKLPEYVFISFQMTFAAITLALVLGATVERMKFSAALVFGIIWLTIVYFPIAHMVWAAGGFLFEGGMFGSSLPAALDFAGRHAIDRRDDVVVNWNPIERRR